MQWSDPYVRKQTPPLSQKLRFDRQEDFVCSPEAHCGRISNNSFRKARKTPKYVRESDSEEELVHKTMSSTDALKQPDPVYNPNGSHISCTEDCVSPATATGVKPTTARKSNTVPVSMPSSLRTVSFAARKHAPEHHCSNHDQVTTKKNSRDVRRAALLTADSQTCTVSSISTHLVNNTKSRREIPQPSELAASSARDLGASAQDRSGRDAGNCEPDDQPFIPPLNRGVMPVSQSTQYPGPRLVEQRDDLICCCPRERDIFRIDMFDCSRCGILQHHNCATSRKPQVLDPSSTLCNICWARQRRPPAPDENARYLSNLHNEAYQLCATVLWKTYCDLPDPIMTDSDISTFAMLSPPRTITAATPPSQAWLYETQARLFDLLSSCKQEDVVKLLGPALAGFPRRYDLVLQPLRDIFMWALHRGPYSRQHHRLGILLEIFGLRRKGTIWNEQSE